MYTVENITTKLLRLKIFKRFLIRSVLSPNCVFQFFVGPFYGLTGRSLLLGGAVSSRENLAGLAKSGNSVKNLANLANLAIR